MIGYYRYPRDKILKIIKSSPKTSDGYYFVRDFPRINNENGKIDNSRDNKYFYNRILFKDKFVFSDDDIKAYMSKDNINFDFERMQRLDKKLLDVIEEFVMYKLDDKIENQQYNLNELIDTTIFIFNTKYY